MLTGNHKAAVDAIIGDPTAVSDERWQSAIAAYQTGELTESIRLFPSSCRIEKDILQRLASRPDAYDKALHALNPRMKSLYLSAWQSALFDMVLAERLHSIERVEEGDLAWKHANGACFLVEDPAVENLRADAFEISASGPLFGASMTWPAGGPREREERVLASEELIPSGPPNGWPGRLDGARRPLRVPISEPSVTQEDDTLFLTFSLPKGSYATAVLREVMKDW
jgi:tRNA pseudouridine13 synthase